MRQRADREQAMVPEADFRSYYGRPILKQPVWKWPVPAYFFTGGLAGGSTLLGLGAGLTGNQRLARHARLTALGALGASTALLIEDLGRPSRFLNMLRVFRPTSPMSMGSWTLAVYGPAAGAVALADITGRVPRLAGLAEVAAAFSGVGVASYTAVLVSDTAVPAWHEARRELPFVFTGSAMAASGGLAMAANPPAVAGPARRMAVFGALVELVASRVSRRRLGLVGEVYDEGKAGRLERAATLLTGAGAVTAAVAGNRRLGAVAGGLALVAGSLATRFAVFEAGRQSAADPRYTVVPQRQRVDAGEPTRYLP